MSHSEDLDKKGEVSLEKRQAGMLWEGRGKQRPDPWKDHVTGDSVELWEF